MRDGSGTVPNFAATRSTWRGSHRGDTLLRFRDVHGNIVCTSVVVKPLPKICLPMNNTKIEVEGNNNGCSLLKGYDPPLNVLMQTAEANNCLVSRPVSLIFKSEHG